MPRLSYQSFCVAGLVWMCALGLLSAQNLVPNPSFEVFKKQPCQFLIFIPNDSASQNLSEYVQDWYAPTSGTTDPWFYNDTLKIGPPPNDQCTQNLKRLSLTAHTGRRCIGINNSVLPLGITPSYSYREYAQTKLLQPLQKGVIYSIEFYVLRSPEAGSASNNLGALLTTKPLVNIDRNFRTYGQQILAGPPQINQPEVVSSTTKWTRIQSCFLADSAYQYLTLGNFYDDQHTTFINYPGYGNQTYLSYYLLDDVSVTKANATTLPPPITVGRDTTLCPNTKYQVSLPAFPTGHYHWQDGDSSTHYTIQKSGTYWVEASSGLCTTSDTIHVQYLANLVLPKDTVICSEGAFWLKPMGSNGPFLWSTGSHADSILIKLTGTYWVQNTNASCLLSDTVSVAVFDCPETIPNVFTPNGDGKNETFYLKNIDVVDWELQIFNRWGAKIYQSFPYHNEWAGIDSPAGTYYYWLSCPLLKRSLKGWVTIIR